MTCDILCIFLYSLSKTLFLKLKIIFNNFTLNDVIYEFVSFFNYFKTHVYKLIVKETT